jgi:hypothetical protein
MRSAATGWLLLGLALAAAGCRAPRSDLVEAELRTKERMLRETREELDRSRLINEALEQDYLRRQQGLPPGPNNPALLSPKDIVIGNGTGGVDDDLKPGDEALQVVVVPRDEDRNPVRALGTLNVAVWEITPTGVKIPLSTWEVNASDLRRTWKSGLIGSGYHVVLPWKKLPTQERLRIAAQLTLPDGRLFEADKDVPIRPLPQTLPPPMEKMPLIPGPESGPIIPYSESPARLMPPRPAS